MDKDRYPDANARASKRLWIMFRSLSTHCFSLGGFEKIKPSVVGLSNTEEDLMEVLALTQPENPCIMPAPIEELRPHAKRLLSSSTPCTYPSIPRGDFLSLLRLMLSIQLDKPEWGPHEPSFYTGRVLIKPDAEILQGAADAILRCSTSSEKRDVDWESFKNVMNIYLVRFLCNTVVISLMTKPKAGFSSTISSHLHILPFSTRCSSPDLRRVLTKHHNTRPIRSVPQSFPTPSVRPPKTLRLRRLRPSRSSLHASNHSSRIFRFTSHTQHHRPRRRSESDQDRHATSNHRRVHCNRHPSPSKSRHWSMHAHAMGHRAKAIISSQPASKATPLHTRPRALPARTMSTNIATSSQRMDHGPDPNHRQRV